MEPHYLPQGLVEQLKEEMRKDREERQRRKEKRYLEDHMKTLRISLRSTAPLRLSGRKHSTNNGWGGES